MRLSEAWMLTMKHCSPLSAAVDLENSASVVIRSLLRRNPRNSLLVLLVGAALASTGNRALAERRVDDASTNSASTLEFHQNLENSPILSTGRSGASQTTSITATPMPSVLRVALALLVVIVLLVGGMWLVRRTVPAARQFGGQPVIEILTRQYLGPKQQLCLIRLNHRLLLIAATTTSVNTITEISDPEEASALIGQISSARGNSISAGFEQWIRSFTRQYSSTEKAVLQNEQDDQESAARAQVQQLMARVRGAGQTDETTNNV